MADPYGEHLVEHFPTCWRCGRTLAEYLTAPWSMRCQRCKAQNRRGHVQSPPDPRLGAIETRP